MLYHYCCPHYSPHQAMNIFSINKPTDCHSRSTSLSTSSRIFVVANISWIHNSRPRYFYNSRHRLNMADCFKTMNQELLRPEDWVLLTVSNSQEKFAKLPTMDILMIRAAPFDTLMHQASYAKNMEISNISELNIEKALALKSTIDPAKKLSTKYHDFLNIFSWADSNILPTHRSYDHKIPLIKEKIPPWGLLYSMSQDELKVLKKYLGGNLNKGFIRASSSLTTSSILFACKPGRGLRFCVNYR